MTTRGVERRRVFLSRSDGREFLTRHMRSGHLWGDRFALWQIRDEDHLRAACEYVMANPVRAGLCAEATAWPWSWSRYPSS
jgi:putative transposase